MKVAIIPPMAHTELAEGDYHLILPQLVDQRKRSAYRLFYQETDGYKILDNGAAEGARVSNDVLMQTAADLKVDEIMVPDVLGDHEQTYHLAKEFAPIAKDYDWFTYAGVVQGRDRAEVVQSVHLFMDIDYINVLAIPRHLCAKISRYIRFDIINALHDDLVERFEAVHFLGSSMWAKEPVLLSDLPVARGMDTSYPTYMGMEGLAIDDPWITRPKAYFKRTIEPENEELTRENIRRYREWAA